MLASNHGKYQAVSCGMANTWVQDWAWAFTTGAWALWVLAALLLWVALFKDRSRGRRRCPKCWYDMTGVPGLKCPECGREAWRERRLFSTRRRWRLAAFGVALALVAVASHRAPTALRHGVWAAVPIAVLNFVLGFWEKEAKALYEQDLAAIRIGPSTVPTRTKWERLLVASVVESTPVAFSDTHASAPASQQWLLAYRLKDLGLELRPALPVLARDLRSTDSARAVSATELIAACAGAGSAEAASLLLDAVLNSESATVRAAAVGALSGARVRNPDVRPALLRIIRGSHDNRCSAVATLAVVSTLTDSQADRRLLVELLHHPIEEVRVHAMTACAINGRPWMIDPLCAALAALPSVSALDAFASTAMFYESDDARWMEALRRAARSDSRPVRVAAADAIGRLARRHPVHSDGLIVELLESDHAEVRERLIEAVPMSSISDEVGGETLRKLLTVDGSPMIRALAANAARQIDEDNPAWLEPLRTALTDPYATVRIHAAAALLIISQSSADAREIVRVESRTCDDPSVRGLLLGTHVRRLQSAEERVEYLWQFLSEDPDPVVHAAALQYLATDREAREQLIFRACGSSASSSDEQQLAALNVLGRMGPLAAAALDRIRELESSPDPRIAAAARDAREKIEVVPAE